MSKSAFLTKIVVANCLNRLIKVTLTYLANIRKPLRVYFIWIVLIRLYLVSILVRSSILIIHSLTVLKRLFTSLLSCLVLLVKLMARFVVCSVMDENTGVSVRTVARLKVRLADLWIVINPCSLTQVRRSFQRAQSSIKELLFQLLVGLLDVCCVSLFTSVLFRIQFSLRYSIRYFLLSLCLLEGINNSNLLLSSFNDLKLLNELNRIYLIFEMLFLFFLILNSGPSCDFLLLTRIKQRLFRSLFTLIFLVLFLLILFSI